MHYRYHGLTNDAIAPSIDRTAELRKYGYHGRHLGSVQMTTDTAARVTRLVVEEQSECITFQCEIWHSS